MTRPDKKTEIGSKGRVSAAYGKSRAVENWLNHALEESHRRESASVAVQGRLEDEIVGELTGRSGAMKGTALYGVDSASLERLGMPAAAVERVYRAMYVYTHGLHDLLQSATKQCHSRSHAMSILWQVFVLLLERCGEMDSGESIQKLVNRGNRELMEAMREEYESHIAVLVQDKNLLAEKYTGIEIEMGQAREEYERCQSEKHLIEHDFRVALQKYELEIRKRMDAEIRLQDVNRWLDTALTELDSARHQNSHSLSLLASSQTEAEDLARTVRQQRERIEGLERDLAGLRDQALDWVQQREKIDKREADLRGQCTRLQSELDTTRSQLRDTNDHASNLSAEVVQLKQETRRLDVNLKTEAEARESASKECTLLRKRLDLSEKTVHRLEGDLRQTASDLSETALKLTSQKAQLTSALEQLKNMSERATQLEILNKDANDRLVHLETSEDKLTMRLEIDRQELERERKLRVEMQTERDSLKALLSAARYQLENTEKDITVVRRELSENSRFSNKLELKGLELQAIIKRQEQSIHSDRKLSARKLSSLEKCLQEEKASKEEAWTSAKAAERARAKLMRALREALTGSDDKGSKLREAACEIDRFQKLLQCYQQQASEQQDTLDRYHATIAAFDGEKMALQAMLEAERTDAQTQSKAAENAFRSALQQHLKTIERWRMRFEDLDSSMRFAPAAEQVKALEAALIAARDLASVHEERTQALEAERDAFEQGFATLERDVLALRAELEVKSKELEESGRRTGQAELDFERAQMRSEDLAVLCMTLKQEAESVSGETARFLSHIRGHLRPSAAGILRHLRRLPEFANIQRLGFINDLLSAVEAQSSDSVGVQWTKEDARVPPDAVFAATGAQTDLTYIYLERKAPTVVDSKPRTERTVRLQKSTREAGAGDPEPSLKIKEMSVVGGVEGQQGRPGSPSQTGHGEKEHGASTLGRSGAVSAISAAASQMLNTSRRTANGKGEDRLSWLSRSKPR